MADPSDDPPAASGSHPSDSPPDKNGNPLRSPGRNSPSTSRNQSRSPNPKRSRTSEDAVQLVGVDRLQKMVLAHELAINDGLRLEEILGSPTAGSLEAQIRETIHQAFWDVLKASLDQSPPDYTHALILLEEIRDTLVSFLPSSQRSPLRDSINDNLDMTHIRRQIAENALDFREKAVFIIVTMGKLCAPARDEEIRHLSTIEEIVPLFREVFRVLEEMKLDMLNFTLMQIRPILDQHSVEYEQQMFDEFLATQEEPLVLTRNWLRKNAQLLLALPSELVPDASGSTVSPPVASPTETNSPWKVSPTKLLRTAFLSLLEIQEESYPETLTADISRILALQAQVEVVIVTAAVMLVTWNTVGQLFSQLPAFKIQLKDDIKALVESPYEDLLTSAAEHMNAQITKSLPLGSALPDLENLKNQIIGLSRKDHPLRQLLMKRLKEFVAGIMISSPIKVPAGLSLMEAEVTQITGQFVRVISRNQTVFGRHYSNVITELADELGLRVGQPAIPSPNP